MSKAIRIEAFGPPSVLKWREVEVGKPGAKEVRVRHTAVGLNFVDVYQRTGLYPTPLPFTPGQEAAGVVEAVGRGVDGLAVGDRVAYAGPNGAYAERWLLPADRMVKLPRGIGDEQAAAMMLKGLTAQYLLRATYRVKAGDTILVHAAAGGVGLILCQWAKLLGATVVGTVGSKRKADLARAHGCDHPVVHGRQSFVDRVKRVTRGEGVPAVYDSIGKATYMDSLDCLRPRGIFVNFGNASGAVPPLEPLLLAQKGSLFLSRPSLTHHVLTRAELEARARDLFRVVRSGKVRIEINQHYALKDAARAHRDLEARKTTGSTVLLP